MPAVQQAILTNSEIQPCSALQVFGGGGWRPVLVPRNGLQDVANIARIAGAQYGSSIRETELPKGPITLGSDSDLARTGDAPENFIEGLRLNRVYANFVVDAPQERFIGDFARV